MSNDFKNGRCNRNTKIIFTSLYFVKNVVKFKNQEIKTDVNRQRLVCKIKQVQFNKIYGIFIFIIKTKSNLSASGCRPTRA